MPRDGESWVIEEAMCGTAVGGGGMESFELRGQWAVTQWAAGQNRAQSGCLSTRIGTAAAHGDAQCALAGCTGSLAVQLPEFRALPKSAGVRLPLAGDARLPRFCRSRHTAPAWRSVWGCSQPPALLSTDLQRRAPSQLAPHFLCVPSLFVFFVRLATSRSALARLYLVPACLRAAFLARPQPCRSIRKQDYSSACSAAGQQKAHTTATAILTCHALGLFFWLPTGLLEAPPF